MSEGTAQNGSTGGKLTAGQFDLALRELELPTFAGVVKRICQAAGGAASPAALQRLTDIVACDPALSARVLAEAARTCDQPPGDIRRACEALGLEALRTVTLAGRLLGDDEPASGSLSGLDYVGFWRHSLAVALAAESLARRTGLDPAGAYTAGLLHDIGKLALEQVVPKTYRRVLEAVQLHVGNITDYEAGIIGIDHGLAGRRLALRWRLGATVEHAAWLCHQLAQVVPQSLREHALLAKVVNLADTMVRARGIGFSGNLTFPRRPAEMGAELGLRESAIDEVARAVEADLRERQALLGLLDGSLSGGDEAMRLANAELGRMGRRLGLQVEELSPAAGAFERLRPLLAALTQQQALDDAMLRLGQAVAGVVGELAEGESLVVYSLEGDGGGLLAMRHAPPQTPQWRTLSCELAAGQACPTPRQAMPADAIIEFSSRLLGDLADQTGWIDPPECAHQAFVCGQRWVGGVVYPARASRQVRVRRTLDHLAEPLAAMLAQVQARCAELRLGEELARAAQTLAGTQEALAEQRVLSAVGEMAAGAAHELNNPLAVISGRAQLMRERAGDDDARRTWQLIADQAHRISDIVTDLMEYASPPQPRPVAVDLHALLRQVAHDFSATAQAAPPRVDISVAEDAPPVWADPSHLRAVLGELLLNAAGAAGSSAPRIRLAAQRDQADGSVLLMVRDEGCGMDASTVANAFTPFFSLQDAGRRRGLGLPKAKRLVEINRGRIWIRSQPAQGSTVYVELPRADDGLDRGLEPAAPAGGDQTPRSGGRNERQDVEHDPGQDQPHRPGG